MKNYAIFQFILLACFISGGDVFAVNNSLTDDTPKTTATQAQVTEEIKKQPILHQPVKLVVKKQATGANPKHNLKPSQSGTEENTGLAEQAEAQQVLNLTVPDKIQETITSVNSPSNKKRDYLPDLFTDKGNKKKKKNKKLQVDGKFISREEEEIGKSRAVDGVGIDFKLTP